MRKPLPYKRYRYGNSIYELLSINGDKASVVRRIVCMKNPPLEYLKKSEPILVKYPIKSTIFSEFVLLK